METQKEYLVRVGLQKPKDKRQWKHGDSHKSSIYALWKDIRKRCYNPESWNYKYYGGKGVRMCDAWLNNYPAFRRWAVANGYSKGLHIHRINNDGDYSPDNCKFLTPAEHALCRTDFKQTPENVEKILALHAQGMTSLQIAPLVNVSGRTIRKVVQKHRENIIAGHI